MRRFALPRFDLASLLLAVLCAAGPIALEPARSAAAVAARPGGDAISAPREQTAPARVADAHEVLRALRTAAAAKEPRRHAVHDAPLPAHALVPWTAAPAVRAPAPEAVGRLPNGNRAPYDATAPPPLA